MQQIKIANCNGADIASIIKNAAAGIKDPSDNGTKRTLVKQPCSGSGSVAALRGVVEEDSTIFDADRGSDVGGQHQQDASN